MSSVPAHINTEPVSMADFLRELGRRADALDRQCEESRLTIRALKQDINLRLFAISCADETPEEAAAIADANRRVRENSGFPDALPGVEFAKGIRERARR